MPYWCPVHAVTRGRPEVAVGSLRAAPVAIMAEHVPWPVTQAPGTPLIGTPVAAPDVTRHPSITAITAKCTLLWSTFVVNAITAK